MDPTTSTHPHPDQPLCVGNAVPTVKRLSHQVASALPTGACIGECCAAPSRPRPPIVVLDLAARPVDALHPKQVALSHLSDLGSGAGVQRCRGARVRTRMWGDKLGRPKQRHVRG
jgi:hypothetical protein